MGKNIDYKELVKNRELWASDEQLSHIPDVILKEYEMLYKSVQDDDICGALFRLKDIYEISMKQPAILAIISISSYIADDNDFIMMSADELKKEYEKYVSKQAEKNIESEALKKIGLIVSRLLKEPLSIGGWKELIEIIIEHADIFEIDDSLKMILIRTNGLLNVKPPKVNGEKGRYENVSNWRNKIIGHGTLLINTDAYWEQVYELIKGLREYFVGKDGESSLSEYYKEISIEQEDSDSDGILSIGKKRYSISEFIYKLEDGQYFFDSYYSRQNYAEITNYLNAPVRLKNNDYYHALYLLFGATKKNRVHKRGRQITNSAEREMYSCLKSVPKYEKPEFVISEMKDFINQNEKGVLYVQMERGMGKSTLAHKLDGRYQRELLQKDLNAIVRVYHVSDMSLRGENKTRDFYTALSNNLLSFNDGQLEVDNEEYYVEGRDIRQLVEGDGEEASLAFCQYLELFRDRYEDEVDDFETDEIKLVYIVDGIDELNSDTCSILNSIPNGVTMQSLGEEQVNNVYIILLSRTKDEDALPTVAKESISICEDKANTVIKINSENDKYYQLLKKFIKNNYKEISEESISNIIENAQRKFLYIQPYMAMGDTVLTPGVKISAYEVARNYINELQKLYCGTSLHTLQLIISAIAVFHVVSLKEICNLILFTEVSYDVIGVLNDILPLLTTKRTDGEDMYAFANEEYEKYIYENMYMSVCEAICRYRISITSWCDSDNRRDRNYGKLWGDYIRRALVVDGVAANEKFCETTEEYVKSLIDLYTNDPATFYSRTVSEELHCNVLNQIRQLKYKDLKLISVNDLNFVMQLRFEPKVWSKLSYQLEYECTQEIVAHCIEKQEVDKWFELIVSLPIYLEDKYYNSVYQALDAFNRIVESWTEYEGVINYLNLLIQKDLENERRLSHGAYSEQLLGFIEEKKLREKIFEGLLNAYYLLAKRVLSHPRIGNIDVDRKEIMSKYLIEAEQYTGLNNYSLIAEIKKVLLSETIYDDTITQIEILAEKVIHLEPREYFEHLGGHFRLIEEQLSDEQIQRYRQAQIKNYRNLLNHMNKMYDEHDIDSLYNWLISCWFGNINCFSIEDKELLVGYLSLFEKVIMLYVEESNIKRIYNLATEFFQTLKCYDMAIRESSIGIYNSYWNKEVDERQQLTSWEQTYALYCSSLYEVGTYYLPDVMPYIVNKFTGKYLQDLFDNGELAQYYMLNSKIKEYNERIDFRRNIIYGFQFRDYRLIRCYYRWLVVRYYRSLEGKDELLSDELYNLLADEYDELSDYVTNLLSNESDLIHKRDMLSAIKDYLRELLCLSKMVPDSISTVVLTKERVKTTLDSLVKNATSKAEIKELVQKIDDIMADSSEWFNADIEFVQSTSDSAIFERFYDK